MSLLDEFEGAKRPLQIVLSVRYVSCLAERLSSPRSACCSKKLRRGFRLQQVLRGGPIEVRSKLKDPKLKVFSASVKKLGS